MRETWYWIIAEFRALGLRCVAFGPEFWLAAPLTVGVVIVSALVLWDVRRGGRL